ncbi:MAG: hypothetical protein Ct9H300mP6_16900 [Gammaproteobacteria bacterium]|nr:MAG: hypothetical protein Ct9H300mP6_16900 [Gammaproteobacteria bacterium]
MGWIILISKTNKDSDRRSLSELNYPTQELICDVDHESLNVLLVVIDALRPDIISAEITPNLYAFKKEILVLITTTRGEHHQGWVCSQSFMAYQPLIGEFFMTILNLRL